ncbi:MAG: hypothetical protein ACYCW6_09655 [Candidatus Xenobia bacterium]
MKQVDETPLRVLIWRLNALLKALEVDGIDRMLEFIAWVQPRLVRPDVKRLYAETAAALLDVRVMRRRGEVANDAGVSRIVRHRAMAEDALELVTREYTAEAGTRPAAEDTDGGTGTC